MSKPSCSAAEAARCARNIGLAESPSYGKVCRCGRGRQLLRLNETAQLTNRGRSG